MKQSLARIITLYTTRTNLLRPNPHSISAFLPIFSQKNRLLTSKRHPSPEHIIIDQSQNRDQPTEGEDDVSDKELKERIERFMGGDEEAIPSIFEAILKRKLAGKGKDSDDELLKQFGDLPNVEVDDDDDDVSEAEFDSEEDEL